MSRAWVDGRWCDTIPVADQGFLLGHGLFETLGLFGTDLPLWPRHLARLREGAGMLGIPCQPPEGLREAGLELLTHNQDDILRITLSAGDGVQPRWVLSTRRRSPSSPAIRLHLGDWRRPLDDPMAGIKSLSYGFQANLLRRARSRGCDDALILETSGAVLETCTANLIFRIGGELCSPSGRNLLPGVAREVLCEEMRQRGQAIEFRPVRLSSAQAAHAVWVCNAVYGPRPAWISRPDQISEDPVLLEAWQAALSRSSPA